MIGQYYTWLVSIIPQLTNLRQTAPEVLSGQRSGCSQKPPSQKMFWANVIGRVVFGMYFRPDCSQWISTKMPIGGVVLHISFIGSPVSSSTNLWDSPESRVKSLDRSPKTQAGLWREQVLQNPAFSCTGGPFYRSHYTYICQFWYITTLFRPVKSKITPKSS